MIVVKVELWPFGDEDAKRVLGTTIIVNDGTGTKEKGNYDTVLADGPIHPHDLFEMREQYRHERIEDWPRSESFWNLVADALWELTTTKDRK